MSWGVFILLGAALMLGGAWYALRRGPKDF